MVHCAFVMIPIKSVHIFSVHIKNPHNQYDLHFGVQAKEIHCHITGHTVEAKKINY